MYSNRVTELEHPLHVAGSHCEVNVDDCEARPCLNGGTCVDRVGGYSCLCHEMHAGPNCQYPREYPSQTISRNNSKGMMGGRRRRRRRASRRNKVQTFEWFYVRTEHSSWKCLSTFLLHRTQHRSRPAKQLQNCKNIESLLLSKTSTPPSDYPDQHKGRESVPVQTWVTAPVARLSLKLISGDKLLKDLSSPLLPHLCSLARPFRWHRFWRGQLLA